MSENLTPTKKRKTKKLGKKELPDGKENILSELSMEQGVALFNQGDYIQAIEIFSFLAGNGDLLARQYLARCYYRLQRYEVAYKHYDYLALNGMDSGKEYAISMVAAIEMMWGNYNKAIQSLRSLPLNTRNTITLAIVYLQKYEYERDEFSVREAQRLIRSLDIDSLPDHYIYRIYHTQALLYQVQKEYRLAQDYYQNALSQNLTDIQKGSVLNDFASLNIELGKLTEAKTILEMAKSLVINQSAVQEAYNHKWFGILAIKNESFSEAIEHLKLAAKIIKEKKLLRDLASCIYIIADIIKDENFYHAAEFFADGLEFQRLSEEINERNEKMIDFIVNVFQIPTTSDIG